MGGRFEHLEFGEGRDKREQPVRRQTGAPKLTAEELQRQADEEYHWGQYESGLRLYTRCLEEDRGRIAAWVGQVQMLVELAEYSEARLWSDKALELFRNNGELLAAKAQACVRMADRKAAWACSDAAVKAAGSSPFRWRVRGEVLLAAGHKMYDACFEKSLAEGAADWFDRIAIARILLFYRKAAAALEYAGAAVDLNPGCGYAWYMVGSCQQELGLKDAALRSFARCLEIRPDWPDADAARDAAGRQSWFSQVFRRLKGGR